MKLISVQSRGDRLITIQQKSHIFILRLAKMGKNKFKAGVTYWFSAWQQTLVAAETWLEGATV